MVLELGGKSESGGDLLDVTSRVDAGFPVVRGL